MVGRVGVWVGEWVCIGVWGAEGWECGGGELRCMQLLTKKHGTSRRHTVDKLKTFRPSPATEVPPDAEAGKELHVINIIQSHQKSKREGMKSAVSFAEH